MCSFFHHGLHMSVPFDSLLVISLVMSESFWPNWVEDKENVVLFWPRWLVKLFKRCTESVLSKATLSLIRGTVCGRKLLLGLQVRNGRLIHISRARGTGSNNKRRTAGSRGSIDIDGLDKADENVRARDGVVVVL